MLATPEGRVAFIRANTRLEPVPHAPELRLHLAHEAVPQWQKTEDELGILGLPPPFWAFAWAGGQALARYVLDHPGMVRGRVLDVATGSGLVAIAAAKAGAARVEANDLDPFALDAALLNAEANGVSVTVRPGNLVGGPDEGWDVVLAGDVSYERDMAAAMTDWLGGLARRGATVLIGDPGRSYLARPLLEEVVTYAVPVTRDLEDAEVKRSSVWRFRDPHCPPEGKPT